MLGNALSRLSNFDGEAIPESPQDISFDETPKSMSFTPKSMNHLDTEFSFSSMLQRQNLLASSKPLLNKTNVKSRLLSSIEEPESATMKKSRFASLGLKRLPSDELSETISKADSELTDRKQL